eukprot:3280142-Rhodomonas_salina.1
MTTSCYCNTLQRSNGSWRCFRKHHQGRHHRQTEVAEEATKVGADRMDHHGAAVEAGAEAEEADTAVAQEAEAFRPQTQAALATSAANGTQASRQRTAASSAI